MQRTKGGKTITQCKVNKWLADKCHPGLPVKAKIMTHTVWICKPLVGKAEIKTHQFFSWKSAQTLLPVNLNYLCNLLLVNKHQLIAYVNLNSSVVSTSSLICILATKIHNELVNFNKGATTYLLANRVSALFLTNFMTWSFHSLPWLFPGLEIDCHFSMNLPAFPWLWEPWFK